MRLFITGATGYIGFNVATAFRRAGYTVWGLTRSKEKASLLARHEIQPIVGNLQASDTFTALAAETDVIIHTTIDKVDAAALDMMTVKELLSVTQQSAKPKTFIYTSSVWVYGDTHGQPVTEQSPLSPVEMVAWRPSVEQMVLNAGWVKGVVIRPGVVYGQSGGLTGVSLRPTLHHQITATVHH